MLKRSVAWARAAGVALRQGGPTMSAAEEMRAALAPPDAPRAATDPTRAAAIAVAERARRDAARAPYEAPDPVPATVTRLRVGRRDADDAVALLAGARPELIFGAYRNPDRLRPTREESQKEWVVIHAPDALTGGPPARPARVELEAGHAWVARAGASRGRWTRRSRRCTSHGPASRLSAASAFTG